MIFQLILNIFLFALLNLALFSLVTLYLAYKYWMRRSQKQKDLANDQYPFVMVQLTIYNEADVAERLIQSVCSLNDPRDKSEIQVLDYLADRTLEKCHQAVKKFQARKFKISLIQRAVRTGYKAGALKAGLMAICGDLVAIFDADFIPNADFLHHSVSLFNDR